MEQQLNFNIIELGTSSTYHQNSEEADAWAEAQGLIVEYPDRYTLQLDLDDNIAQQQFQKSYRVLRRILVANGLYSEIRITKSRTPGHQHARIRLPFSVTPLERIALQACLGSDGKRELLSVFDLRNGDPRPTLFFESEVR